MVQAAMREGELGHEFPVRSKGQTLRPMDPSAMDAAAAAQAKLPVRGTVVLDVEQGGIEVPSFVGKTVRAAVESAEDAGLQLEAVGSGVGRQQSPPAGTHVAAGSRVTVQFGR
jgi:cell division protein FtsI (penicillin-binding protein 3)